MNMYYHNFVPGFNLWYVLAPGFIVLMAVLAAKNVYASSVTHYASQYYTNALFKIIAAICSIIISVLITIESGFGLVQLFDNMLTASDSGVWSILFAVLAIPALGYFYYHLLMTVEKIVRQRKVDILNNQPGVLYGDPSLYQYRK